MLCCKQLKPLPKYADKFNRIGALMGHMRNNHDGRTVCELCLLNGHSFIHEQRIFNKQELINHEQFGSNALGSRFPKTQAHAYCNLCHCYFFNRDQLFEHCQSDHYSCHFCQQNSNRSNICEFYKTIKILEQHYRNLHYLCEHPMCIKQQYIVFNDHVELQVFFYF